MKQNRFPAFAPFLAFLAFALSALPGSTHAQALRKQIGDFIESTSINDSLREVPRKLNYYPEGGDFVCVNGVNRYTRALYGSHTAFRLETSDRPVFAIYDDKGLGGNISFSVNTGGNALPLDQTAFCESRYTPGKRSYRLTDPSWGKGELHIAALALPDADGAVWRFSASGMPKGATLHWKHGGATRKKLSRNGDIGVDTDDCFELKPGTTDITTGRIELSAESFFVWGDVPGDSALGGLYRKAEAARAELASRVRIDTPDPYFNTVGGALAVAADGIWSGEVWLHGAVGWRMPLSGWRAAYTGDALGWHDRARTHFNAYAASQVTSVPQTIPHPAQDPEMNFARSLKKWGTPQYSDGYICRNPARNDQMHHYDMNLCYMDELLWHLNWTGDLEYARAIWPVIARHLAWEKLNYDPDNDGLYDAYACIWASDALYYNSGAVTYSTAYNYRANHLAAQIAEKIGEDPQPYRSAADKTLKALNDRLWMPRKGVWAEYQDFMGKRRLHESPGVWTVYHAIDSDVADPFQAFQATRYVDTGIPHIPVVAEGLKDEGYETISTTNWFPYSWSVNNVAFAEVMHTALAYFQAGRKEEGFKLLKSSMLDGMYLGRSPGNFGQVSFYDAARGECYRDFGDPVGVASRVYVQGLFGVQPDALNGRLLLRPGFPQEWEHASLTTPDLSFTYVREGDKDIYTVEQQFARPLAVSLQVHARKDDIRQVTVNGRKIVWKAVTPSVGHPQIVFALPAGKSGKIEIVWSGNDIHVQRQAAITCRPGDIPLLALPYRAEEVYDPQEALGFATLQDGGHTLRGTVKGIPGHRTLFVKARQGAMEWWHPVALHIPEKSCPQAGFAHVKPALCHPVDMDERFNASVTDIFRNRYLTPRSPYTTLQLPVQGIGEWCHPKLIAGIDDSGVRALAKDGVLPTDLGVSFRTPAEGDNIAYTSLWDNYPDSIVVPLQGKASRAYLLMAGSTNHMQCHIVNGVVKVRYTDGASETLELINPVNWCSIEQDFYADGAAFKLKAPRPYRLHLKSGLVSDNLEKELNIKGVYGREIEGGAGVLLEMELDPRKELSSLTVETLSNDVVIGLMGVTLQRPE